jgi:predicted KAP-like P-loop ATPase
VEADRPIHKSSEDRFGRWHFAQRVAQVIANRNDSNSIVIGIHAPWGEGKTSVLNMIVEELKKHEHVLIVHFNPWRFPDETLLLKAFFRALADVVDSSLETRGEKLGDFAKKYAGLLAPVSFLGFNASEAVKGIAEISPTANLEQLKERIEEILNESGKRIVVVMDDIDRLDKEEVQATFRLVKLSADFPNTAYVLAFDDRRVAEALIDKYGSLEAGRSFLEKIVQVPLPLPPASIKARRSLTLEGIKSALNLAKIELSAEQNQRFADIFDKAFLHRIETPRLAKRFANAMTFALPILGGEVEIIDLILLEAIRAFYPHLYTSIRENEEIFLGTVFDWAVNKNEVESRVVNAIEESLKGLEQKDKHAARLVLQELFPQSGAEGKFRPGSYGAEHKAVWAREKRIASKYYFRRYFTYGVPLDDISDKEIEQFIKNIPNKDLNYIKDQIIELSANDRAEVLIEKLRSFEDELPANVSKALASGIAVTGKLLPQSSPIDRFFGFGSSAQAVAMIRHLVQRIPDENERELFALELAGIIEPLPLAFEYSRWMMPLKRSYYSDEKVAVVSKDCEEQIYKLIAMRIANEANQEPLERKYPRDAQVLYQFWFNNDNDGVRNYVQKRIASFPKEAAEFLAAILDINPEAKSDRNFEHPDAVGWYELITKMIPPDTLLAALREVYPDIDSPQYFDRVTGQTDGRERAAKWFVKMNYDKRS